MSLQRAAVHCNRCHGLASAIKKELEVDDRGDDGTIALERLENDQLYVARNDAMKACEDGVVHAMNMIQKYLSQDDIAFEGGVECSRQRAIHRLIRDTADRGLDLCVGCDYSEPLIAQQYEQLQREFEGSTDGEDIE